MKSVIKIYFYCSHVWSYVFAPVLLMHKHVKHPRVAEVEKYLSREALDLLKARFPQHPFMATVSIDPVHRGNSTNANNRREKLPYLEVDSEEIVDEWDDPALSNIALLIASKKSSQSLCPCQTH
jgi:hypothetical protein